jgi:hypothetical protein
MKPFARSGSDPWFAACAGVLLLGVAAVGLWRGVRAGVATILYHEAKYGAAAGMTEKGLQLCRLAYRWYPSNYRFSILVAEQAYYGAASLPVELRQPRLQQAQFWCERGLIQNPWKSQLRRLKTRFLLQDSPLKAVRYWKEFTDWQFWEPYNHAVLVELYSQTGEFDKAEQELKWVEGSASYAAARQFMIDQRKSWDEALMEDGVKWGE